MKVSIVGMGYVGLVTGVCLAEKGHEVVCIDVDREKIEKVRCAISPIYEQGLEELLRKHASTRLQATTNLCDAILETEVTLIAVGTPFDGDKIDLTYIRDAALDIGQALRGKSTYHLVAVKSTVVPGTTDEVVLPLLEAASGKKAGRDFGVGMNPEFLTEGEAIADFMFPDRLILGGIDDRSIDVLTALYAPFHGVEQLRTNNRTAEMIKYASNAFLATTISFANEMANLCSALGGIDVVDVMQGLHLSKYLSPNIPEDRRILAPISAFLWAGCGFGGSCLPKDVKALIAHGNKVEIPMRLLDAVIRINEEQPRELLKRLSKHFPSLQGVRVAVLGLAFRPGTNDMRESPAISIIHELLARGADVTTYDPAANHEAAKLFHGCQVTLCDDLEYAIGGSQAIILVTRWAEFNKIPELLAGQEPPPVFIDGRRMLNKASITRYEGIGL
jgi:UDPglucose 6-dehydrogenase/GDP-mannose 6-dehydrogenase